MNKLKLILGLGNIGEEYARTRHNIGFYVVDQLAHDFVTSWQSKSKFKALVATVKVDSGGQVNQKIILAKPNTFYNLSGEAAQAISSFYNISPEDILVIHDDIDIPFGRIRARLGGSDAGNNGIKSVTSYLGANYPRIRIGTANQQLSQSDAADFVLNKFTAHELAKLSEITKQTRLIVNAFLNNDTSFIKTIDLE